MVRTTNPIKGKSLSLDTRIAMTEMPAGNAGEVLTGQGAGVSPAYAAAASVHIEAKATSGAAASQSGSWTVAFSGTPVVVAAPVAGASPMVSVMITARSATGFTVESRDYTNAQIAVVKTVMAMEAT